MKRLPIEFRQSVEVLVLTMGKVNTIIFLLRKWKIFHILLSLVVTTTTAKKLNDATLLNHEGKCINALSAVQKSLDNIDRLQYSHSTDTQTELTKLITTSQSHLHQSNSIQQNDIELLIAQYIENWNNQKKSNTTQIHNRDLSSSISQAIEEAKFQELSKPIRCRRIPYTSTKERTSAISLHQVVISSKSKDLVGVKHMLDENHEANDGVQSDQGQTEWLASLLSKISDNVDTTTSPYF